MTDDVVICEPGHTWFQTTVPFRSKAFEHTESLEPKLTTELGEGRKSRASPQQEQEQEGRHGIDQKKRGASEISISNLSHNL